MESWAIFKHAVRMVFGNLGDAIRVTGVSLLFFASAQSFFMGDTILTHGTIEQGTVSLSFSWQYYAMTHFPGAILYAVPIIAWYRFVLLKETKLLSSVNWKVICYYLFNALLLLVLTLPLLLFAYILGIGYYIFTLLFYGYPALNFGPPYSFYVLGLIAFQMCMIPLVYAGFRFSAVFPAAATAKWMNVSEAWDRLTGKSGAIFGLSLIFSVFLILLQLPKLVFGGSSTFLQVYAVLSAWIQMMIGSTLVVTLYNMEIESQSTAP
jgi:hypothetical protein